MANTNLEPKTETVSETDEYIIEKTINPDGSERVVVKAKETKSPKKDQVKSNSKNND